MKPDLVCGFLWMLHMYVFIVSVNLSMRASLAGVFSLACASLRLNGNLESTHPKGEETTGSEN